MRFLRALGGALLWIVASVVCLLALVLCVTIVLLPLGIPLLMLGRKLFGQSVRLFVPRAAAHPLKTSRDASKSAAKGFVDGLGDQLSNIGRPDGTAVRKRVKKNKKKLLKVVNA